MDTWAGAFVDSPAASGGTPDPLLEQPPQQPPQQPPRKHVRRACKACQKNKSKCSGEEPSCARCTRLNKVCEYAPLAPRRTRPPADAGVSPAELAQQVAVLTAELRQMKELLMERQVLPAAAPGPVEQGSAPEARAPTTRSSSEQPPLAPERELSNEDKAALIDLFFNTFNQMMPVVDPSLAGSMVGPQTDAENLLQHAILALILRLDGNHEASNAYLSTARKIAGTVFDADSSRVLVSAMVMCAVASFATGDFPKMKTYSAVAFQKGEDLGLAPPDPLHITTTMIRRFSQQTRDIEARQRDRMGPRSPMPDHPALFGTTPTHEMFADMNAGLASLAMRTDVSAWECSYWTTNAISLVLSLLHSSQRHELSPEFAETLLTTLDHVAALTEVHAVAGPMGLILIACLQAIIAQILFVLGRHDEALAQIRACITFFQANQAMIHFASPMILGNLSHSAELLVQLGALPELRSIRDLVATTAANWAVTGPIVEWLCNRVAILEMAGGQGQILS